MRIANKVPRPSAIGRNAALLTALLLSPCLFSASAQAAAEAAPALPPMAAPPAATNMDGSVPMAAMAPGAPAPMNSAPGVEMGKSVTALENKITDGAKSVIKNLDASTDAMTLEDLNSAHQTVARIEAIIDVEKHMAELEKLRNDRNGVKSSSSLANLLPASVLQPPPSVTRSMAMDREMPKPIMMSSPEISRIMGSEGRYIAVLKVNGENKTVHPGDTLSGGSIVVQSIAASSVVLDENGKSKTLHIKNVDAIYSAMR